jgi:NAD(P)-dependent dehydrogenase (short-subunit alcohol dehydrogenase family)
VRVPLLLHVGEVALSLSRPIRLRIVNVASGAGTRPIPNLSAYVTSKAALLRLTENLAAEARGAGVRVFAVQPGTVRTAMAEAVLHSGEARRLLPWFPTIFEQSQDAPPERAGRLVVLLATGRADALSGRFLAVEWDVEALARRARNWRARPPYLLVNSIV